MPEPDTGFAPKEEEELMPPKDPEEPEVYDTEPEKVTPRLPISTLCNGGYHGMCQGSRSTCRCPCHQATRRKPIEPLI